MFEFLEGNESTMPLSYMITANADARLVVPGRRGLVKSTSLRY